MTTKTHYNGLLDVASPFEAQLKTKDTSTLNQNGKYQAAQQLPFSSDVILILLVHHLHILSNGSPKVSTKSLAHIKTGKLHFGLFDCFRD